MSVFDERLDSILAKYPGGAPKAAPTPPPREYTPSEQKFIDAVKDRFPGAEVIERPPGPETLVRVTAPDFVAGFVLQDGIVRRTAPILRKHLLGKLDSQAREIIRANKWTAHIVPIHENNLDALVDGEVK